jgi:HEAT repeat protein
MTSILGKIKDRLDTNRTQQYIVEGVFNESELLRQIALKRLERDFIGNEKVIKDIMKHLKEDNDYACQALSILIPKGDANLKKKLVEEASSNMKSEKIVQHVCCVLGHIAETYDIEALRFLLEQCDHPSEKVNLQAIKALQLAAHNTGDLDVIDKLIEKLDSFGLRDASARALGSVAVRNQKRAVEALSKHAKTFDGAVNGLETCCEGDQEVVTTLLYSLMENSLDEIATSEAIKKVMGPTETNLDFVVERLMKMLKHKKKRVAKRAAVALGIIVPRGESIVVALLQDMLANPELKENAVIAIGNVADIGDMTIIADLLTIFDDPNATMALRENTAEALGKLCEKNTELVMRRMCERLKKGDEGEVMNAIVDALQKIAPQDHPDVVQLALTLTQHMDGGIVEGAVHLLGELCSRGKNPKFVSIALAMLNSNRSENLRCMCADALGQVVEHDDWKVIPLIQKIAMDKGVSPTIRAHCIKAIGRIITIPKDEVTEELFSTFAMEKNPIVRKETINTLAKICDLSKMIRTLKKFKEVRTLVYEIIVKSIRHKRFLKSSFDLANSDVDALEKMGFLEAKYIIMENEFGREFSSSASP